MGEITPEQAENHPARSTLLRSLGTPNIPTGYIDSYLANHPEATFDLKPGETLLLVTDGVWDLISPAEMQAAFTGAVQAGCTALIDLALERGAPDNATALAIRG
jgi:protein phosphatase